MDAITLATNINETLARLFSLNLDSSEIFLSSSRFARRAIDDLVDLIEQTQFQGEGA